MSSTPEAKPKYSRDTGDSRRSARRRRAPRRQLPTAVRFAVLGGGFLAAALLIVSEFAQLYSVHTSSTRAALQTVTVHAHNAFAMLPIAALAVALTWGATRDGSPPALLAIGLLGVIALLIALIGDLPDAQASGIVLRAGNYEAASSSPSLGLYLETLGAVLLVITAGAGLLLGGPAGRPRTRSAEPSAEQLSGS
jgi:hypothetical protein